MDAGEKNLGLLGDDCEEMKTRVICSARVRRSPPIFPVSGAHLSPGLVFLEHVLRIGLLRPNVVEAFLVNKAEHLGDLDSAQLFGDALVEAGLLTQYQLDRLLAGSTHGLLLGNYRVLDRIGAGAMGVVFLGEHTMMNRRVAIKVMPFDDDSPAEYLDRFYAEMQVLAELHHPNIVMAYDSGRVECPAPGLPSLLYLVMEYIDGCDLDKYVMDHGRLPVAQACRWISQAAFGLQEAHNRLLIHRDVKPSNMLLTKAEQVKLLDFGLVRQFALRMTDPKALLGTVEFMAPEQSCDPSAVSSHADIYSLGASLFWLLTGEPPYAQVRSVNEALKQLQHASPRKLRQLRPDAPPNLEALMDRLLERDPMRRPSMPIAVARYLQPFTSAN